MHYAKYNALGAAFTGTGGIWIAAGHPGIALFHFVTAMAFFTVVLVLTRPKGTLLVITK